MRFHTLNRCPTVRFKHLVFIDLLVLEELVGGMGFRPTLASSVDACLRIGGQPSQDLSATPVQSYVSKIDSGQLILNPLRRILRKHTVPQRGPPWFGSIRACSQHAPPLDPYEARGHHGSVPKQNGMNIRITIRAYAHRLFSSAAPRLIKLNRQDASRMGSEL